MGGLDCRYLVNQLRKEIEGGNEHEGDEEEGSSSVQQGGEYRREGGPERMADEEDKAALAAELKRKGLPPFRVLSVTTIATPHRGSAFADYFLSTLGRKYYISSTVNYLILCYALQVKISLGLPL
jgi:triacylglycerol esterase/lipase EstA (alpha/beta hydrolase family)